MAYFTKGVLPSSTDSLTSRSWRTDNTFAVQSSTQETRSNALSTNGPKKPMTPMMP